MRARAKVLVVAAIALGAWSGATWIGAGPSAVHAVPASPVAPAADTSKPTTATEPATREAVVAEARPLAARAPEHAIAALDAILARDPAEALAAARNDDAAYPSSRWRAERKWVEIQALVHMEAIGAARSEAYAFYADYPDHPRSIAIEAMTGMHRGRVAERVNAP